MTAAMAAVPYGRSRRGVVMPLKALGDPHLDDRLAGDAQSLRLAIEGLDHPGREIHVHPSLLIARTAGRSEIERRGDVFAPVEPLLELFSFHRSALPHPVSGAPR